jgi:hypothetical protein
MRRTARWATDYPRSSQGDELRQRRTGTRRGAAAPRLSSEATNSERNRFNGVTKRTRNKDQLLGAPFPNLIE